MDSSGQRHRMGVDVDVCETVESCAANSGQHRSAGGVKMKNMLLRRVHAPLSRSHWRGVLHDVNECHTLGHATCHSLNLLTQHGSITGATRTAYDFDIPNKHLVSLLPHCRARQSGETPSRWCYPRPFSAGQSARLSRSRPVIPT